MWQSPGRLALVLMMATAATSSPRAQGSTILNGTWLFRTITFNGNESADGHTSLLFSGNMYEQAVDGNVNESGFVRLDQTRTPMTIDFIVSDGGPTQLNSASST